MKVDNDGNLKRCRGKTLPVKVLPSAKKREILEKAVRKHANHDNNIHGELEHVLLNVNGKEITNLPGTEKEFVLSEYKEDIGKNYNRLTLFIALKSAYMYTEISKLKRSCDDSEPETIADLSDEMFLETDDTIGIELSPCPSSSPCEPSTSLHIATNLPMNTPPIYNSQSASNYVSRSKELKCECPTCQQYFSIDEIAEHADICCDIWVGALQSQNTDSEKNIPEENPDVVINQDNATNVKDKLLDIKAVTLSPKAVRLNVRRKNIWCDFIEYRSSGKVSPTDSVKIVFVGECAIYDGGPKREFFQVLIL